MAPRTRATAATPAHPVEAPAAPAPAEAPVDPVEATAPIPVPSMNDDRLALREIMQRMQWTDRIQQVKISYPQGHPEGLQYSDRRDYCEASFAISDDEILHLMITDATHAELFSVEAGE